MALLDKLRLKNDSSPGGVEFKVGDTIDQRYLVRNVRKGFMGIVYIARDLQSNQTMALKTFQNKFTWVESAIANFTREAEVWMRLGSHPNIVQATRILEIAGRPYIVMEFVPGTALRSLMERGRLRFKDIIDFAIQICRGMQYAYDHCAIIHRDLKPDNVMITPEGSAKVTDFGLAQAVTHHSERWRNTSKPAQPINRIVTYASDLFGGSQPYMSPEQRVPGTQLGPWSDIYSMGVMLYEMMIGDLPFRASTVEELTHLHCHVPPPVPSEVRPDLRRGCDHVLLRCLAKSPSDRYQSFEELERDLQWLRKYHIGEEYPELELAAEHEDGGQWNARGVAHMSLAEYSAAFQCFNMATELEPHHPSYWINLGSSQIGMLAYNEALRTFQHALTLHPETDEQIRCHLMLGEIYEHQYQLREALEEYDHTIKLNKKERRAWLGRGRVYNALVLPKEAFQAFEQATKLDAKEPQAWYCLGQIMLDQNQPRDALYYFDKALALSPRDARIWCGKGQCLIELRRIDEARQAYETAYKLDPNLPEAVMGLSQIRGSRPLA